MNRKVLFLRVNPSSQYTTSEGEQASLEKRARWLIVREWIVTFLRYPLGVWAYEKDKTLVYLFYDHDSNLIDKRPEFNTVVAYKPLAVKGSAPRAEGQASSALYVIAIWLDFCYCGGSRHSADRQQRKIGRDTKRSIAQE